MTNKAQSTNHVRVTAATCHLYYMRVHAAARLGNLFECVLPLICLLQVGTCC